MNFFYSNVLISPGGLIDKSPGGVLFPNMSERPYNFGTVLAAGKHGPKYPVTVRAGDVVAYHMLDPGEVDGVNKSLIEIDGSPALVMDEAMIQCRITNPEMKKSIGLMIKNKKKKDFVLDYEKDIEMLGYKIAVELRQPDEKTASGIILPEVKMNKTVSYGRIVAVSRMANIIFADDEELKPGMEVIIDRAPSGGLMPMTGEKKIWRTNSHEVSAKFDPETGKWRPVGGRVFLKPAHLFHRKIKEKVPHPTLEGVQVEQEVWVDTRNPSVVYPITHRFMPFQSEVVDVGCGWSEHYSNSRVIGDTGKPPYEPGDIVIHLQILNSAGQLVRGIEQIELNGQELLMMPTNVIEGKITGHAVNTFKDIMLEPADHGI